MTVADGAIFSLVSALILGYILIYMDYRNDKKHICYADGSLRPIYFRLTPYQRFLAVTISPIRDNLEMIYIHQLETWYRGVKFIPDIDPKLSPTQLETLRLMAVAEIKHGNGIVLHCLKRLLAKSRSTATYATFK